MILRNMLNSDVVERWYDGALGTQYSEICGQFQCRYKRISFSGILFGAWICSYFYI